MLRENNVKDEEGYTAVFTERGASTSQMVAARVLDTMSKLLGMAGEISDAISAYNDAHRVIDFFVVSPDLAGACEATAHISQHIALHRPG